MNTNEIITREYVYRKPSETKKETKTQKKGKDGSMIKVVVALALVVAIVAGILAVNSSKVSVAAGPSSTVSVAGNIASAANLITITEKTEEETTDNSGNLNYLLSKYFATVTDSNGNAFLTIAEKSEENTDSTESNDSIIGDGSLIGSLGFITGLLDAYRADDPALPSYLKVSYNKNFCMDLSDEEIELLCKLVEAEAPAEDIFGKILVANVVLNRVLSNRGFANTVSGVIYEKYGKSVQFASAHNKAYWNSIVISDTTREAVTRALAGEDYSEGALFFFAWKNHPELTPTTGWTKLYTYVFKHGGHAFYK